LKKLYIEHVKREFSIAEIYSRPLFIALEGKINDLFIHCIYLSGIEKYINAVKHDITENLFVPSCKKGSVELVNRLIEHVTNCRKISLGFITACSSGNLGVVKILLPVNDNDMLIGLFVACVNRNFQVVKCILEHEKFTNQWKILMLHALASNCPEIINFVKSLRPSGEKEVNSKIINCLIHGDEQLFDSLKNNIIVMIKSDNSRIIISKLFYDLCCSDNIIAEKLAILVKSVLTPESINFQYCIYSSIKSGNLKIIKILAEKSISNHIFDYGISYGNSCIIKYMIDNYKITYNPKIEYIMEFYNLSDDKINEK